MAKCAYCGTGIFFGGVRAGDKRYCNRKCYEDGTVIAAANQVSPDIIREQTELLHSGNCPRCHGRGPVDVHTSYLVYSFIVMTRWSNVRQISCRGCAAGEQLKKLGICLVAGWWGIPSGLILTPIQITRNIIGLLSPPDPARPSPALERVVRVHIGTQLLAQSRAQQAAAVPPPAAPSAPPPLSSPPPVQEPPSAY
jgi:hypothetical protein